MKYDLVLIIAILLLLMSGMILFSPAIYLLILSHHLHDNTIPGHFLLIGKTMYWIP